MVNQKRQKSAFSVQSGVTHMTSFSQLFETKLYIIKKILFIKWILLCLEKISHYAALYINFRSISLTLLSNGVKLPLTSFYSFNTMFNKYGHGGSKRFISFLVKLFGYIL